MARQNQNRQDGQVAHERGAVAGPAPVPESGRALRLAALAAVMIGLAALTAAACVLSYEHIQHLALQSGVSTRLANVYPLILDALLVLAGCSVLALRGAGLASRIYAWLCTLVLLAGLAGGGAVNAAGVRFSRKDAAIAAAAVPWLLVLIGFGLLLALLRYARQRRQANRASITEHQAEPLPPEIPDVVPTAPRPAPEPAGPGTAARAAPQPRPGPAGAAADAPVPNPALAALMTADSRAEPVTAPQPAVSAAGPAGAASGQAPATHDRDASGPPSPGVQSPAGPVGADLTKPGPHRLPVRQADLQLRARIPRPAPASGGPPPAAAGAMQAGSHQNAPFMPRVAPQQGSVPQQAQSADQPAGAPPDAGPAQPPSGDHPAPAPESTDRADPAEPSAAQGQRPDDDPSAAPAGTVDKDADDETPGGLPGFMRQRSSPTPPDEE